ncbi:hypothetical protein SeMB42_g07618, partial [Synchytrium endobioticum]
MFHRNSKSTKPASPSLSCALPDNADQQDAPASPAGSTSSQNSSTRPDASFPARAASRSKSRTRSSSSASKFSVNDDNNNDQSPEPALPDLLSQTAHTVQAMPTISPRYLNSLQLAVHKSDVKTMHKLMSEVGRDLNKLDTKHGFTAVHLAIYQHKMDVFKELVGLEPHGLPGLPALPGLRRCGLNTQDNHGRSPLVLATIFSRNEMVAHLIALGADCNSLDNVGCTALHYAMLTDNKFVFDLVLAKKPALSIYDRTQNTLLHHAVRLRRVEMAKALVATGANIDTPNGTKKTPLHVAVEKNVEELARFLIEHGANVDTVDEQNHTPVDYAKHNPALQEFIFAKRHAPKAALLQNLAVPQSTQPPTSHGTAGTPPPPPTIPLKPASEPSADPLFSDSPNVKVSSSREKLTSDGLTSTRGLPANKAIRDLKKSQGAHMTSKESIGGSIQLDELELAPSPPDMSEVSDPTPPSSGSQPTSAAAQDKDTHKDSDESSDSSLWNTLDLTEAEIQVLRGGKLTGNAPPVDIPVVSTPAAAAIRHVVAAEACDDGLHRETESEISDADADADADAAAVAAAAGLTEPVEMVSEAIAEADQDSGPLDPSIVEVNVLQQSQEETAEAQNTVPPLPPPDVLSAGAFSGRSSHESSTTPSSSSSGRRRAATMGGTKPDGLRRAIVNEPTTIATIELAENTKKGSATVSVSRSSSTKALRRLLSRRSRQPSMEISMPEPKAAAPFDPSTPRPERMGLDRMLAQIEYLQDNLGSGEATVATALDEIRHIVDETRGIVSELNFERRVMLQQYSFVQQELDLHDGLIPQNHAPSAYVDFALISTWVANYKQNSGPELARRARAIEQKECEIKSLNSKLQDEITFAATTARAHSKQLEQKETLHAQQVEALEAELADARKKANNTRSELEETLLSADEADRRYRQQVADLTQIVSVLEKDKEQLVSIHRQEIQQQASIRATIEAESSHLKQKVVQLNADLVNQQNRLNEEKARALDRVEKDASIKIAEKQGNLESLKKTVARLEERVRERSGTADETYKKLDEARAEADKYRFEAEALTKRVELDAVRSSNLKREVALMRRMMGLPDRPESLGAADGGVPTTENPDKEYFTRLENECLRLQKQVDELQVSRRALESARETERFRVEELADEVKNMSKALRNEKTEHATASGTIAVLTLDLEKSRAVVTDLQGRLQQLESERPKWTADLIQVEQQVRQKYESEVARLRQELDSCKEHLAAEKVALELRDRQLSCLRQQIKDAIAPNTTLPAGFQQPIEIGQDMVRYFDSEIKLLTQSLEHETELRKHSESEKQRVFECVSDLETSLADVRQLYEAELATNQAMTISMQRLTGQLASSKTELSTAMDKIHEQELKAVRLQSDVQSATLQQQQQTEIIAKLDGESMAARAEVKALHRQLEDKQRRASELESHVALLDLRLVDQTALAHSFEKDAAISRTECTQLREQLITAETNVNSLTHRLRSAERALQEQQEAGIRADEDTKDLKARFERELREQHCRAQEERDATDSESRMAHDRYKAIRAELEQQRTATMAGEAALGEKEMALHKARVEIMQLDAAKADLEAKLSETQKHLQAELDRARINSASVGSVLLRLRNMETSKSPLVSAVSPSPSPVLEHCSLGNRSRSRSSSVRTGVRTRVRTWSEPKQDAGNVIDKFRVLQDTLVAMEAAIQNESANWTRFMDAIEADLNLDGGVKATVQTLAQSQQDQFGEMQVSITLLKDVISQIMEASSAEISNLQESVKTLTAYSEQRDRELNAEIDAIRAEWKSEVATIQSECRAKIVTMEAKLAVDVAALETRRAQERSVSESNVTDKISIINDLTEAKTHLQAHVTQLESQLRQLSMDFSEERSKVAAAELAQSVLERRLPNLEHQIRYLEQELSVHEPKLADSESSRLALVSRAFELEKDVQNKAAMLGEKEHIISGLTAQIQSTEKRAAELTADVSTRDNELKLVTNNLQSAKQTLLGELSLLRDQNTVLQNSLDAVTTRASDLTTQLAAAKRAVDQIQADYEAARAESQTLQTHIKHFKAAAETDQKAAEEYLKLKVTQLEEQARVSKAHDQELLVATQRQLEVSEADAQKLWKAKVELEKDLHVVSEQRASLEAELRSCVAEHEVERKSFEDKRRNLEDSLCRANAQIEQLHAQVESLFGTHTTDEVDKRALEFSCKTNEERLKGTHDQLKLVETQVTELLAANKAEREGRIAAELEASKVGSEKRMLDDVVSTLKRRTSSLETALHDQVAESDTIMKRIALLEEDRDKSALEKDRLVSSLKTANEARVSLENQVRQYQAALDKANAELSALNTLHARSTRDAELSHAQLESEKKMLAENVKSLQDRVVTLEASLRQQIAESDSIMKKTHSLDADREKAELEKSRLLVQLKTSNERVAALEASLHKQIAETDSVLKKVQLLEEDREKAELEKSRLVSQLKTSNESRHALDAEVRQYRAALDQTSLKMTTLSTQHAQLESDVTLGTSKLESEKRVLLDTVERLKERVVSLESSLHQQMGECDAAMKKAQLSDVEREKAELERSRLQQVVDKLKERVASLESSLHSQVSESDGVMKKAHFSDVEREKMELERLRLQATIEKMKDRIASLEALLHKQVSESDKTMAKAQVADTERERSELDKARLERTVDKLKDRITCLEASLHHQVLESDTYMKKAQLLEEEHERSELEKARLHQSAQASHDAKVAMELEVRQYQTTLDVTSTKLSLMTSQHAQLENECKNLKFELSTLEDAKSQLSQRLHQRQGQLEAAVHDLEKLKQAENEWTQLKAVFEFDKRGLEDKKAFLESQLKSRQQQLGEATNEAGALAESSALWAVEKAHLEFEKRQLEERVHLITEQLKAAQGRLSAANVEIEELCTAKARLENAKSVLETRALSAEAQFKSA